MSEPVMGRIHSIETLGAVDGPGLRYVVFVQGCPLKCLYCHNPDSWDFNKGTLTNSKSVVENIKPYIGFIKNGGVTISGGEPLAQPDFVLDIISRCHELGLHVAIDTSGAINLGAVSHIIDAADLLLLDIKAIDKDVFKELTSVPNTATMKLLEYTRVTNKPIWIRHVLVPGYTLDTTQLEKLADFLMLYPNIEKVELLPFHKMGEYKWQELGKEYKLFDTREPTLEEVKDAEDIFRKRGLIK
ncbi:MAG: pyruvate formate lyase-activating protein [Clostridiales bacterium]|nr:pyruvate formate lyase-activating protein [Clostridiales bacterium]